MNKVYLIYHNAGREYALKETEDNIIGRGIDGESTATVALPHPSISREHANIKFCSETKRWIFYNLSRNPSEISGKSVHEKKQLQHGDQINIGPFSFSFFEKSLALEDTMELPIMKPREKSLVSDWEDNEKTPLGSIIEAVVMIFFILLSLFIFFYCFVW